MAERQSSLQLVAISVVRVVPWVRFEVVGQIDPSSLYCFGHSALLGELAEIHEETDLQGEKKGPGQTHLECSDGVHDFPLDELELVQLQKTDFGL